MRHETARYFRQVKYAARDGTGISAHTSESYYVNLLQYRSPKNVPNLMEPQRDPGQQHRPHTLSKAMGITNISRGIRNRPWGIEDSPWV